MRGCWVENHGRCPRGASESEGTSAAFASRNPRSRGRYINRLLAACHLELESDAHPGIQEGRGRACLPGATVGCVDRCFSVAKQQRALLQVCVRLPCVFCYILAVVSSKNVESSPTRNARKICLNIRQASTPPSLPLPLIPATSTESVIVAWKPPAAVVMGDHATCSLLSTIVGFHLSSWYLPELASSQSGGPICPPLHPILVQIGSRFDVPSGFVGPNFSVRKQKKRSSP